MFAVKCEAAFVWHPAVHHSLLLLRALKQRHTLLLEPSCTPPPSSDDFWRLTQSGSRLCITAPITGLDAPSEGKKEREKEPHRLNNSSCGLERVHNPQHILYFFSSSFPFVQEDQQQQNLQNQFQAYLDATLVADHVLRATDDVLLALSTKEMGVIQQTHANLIDVVSRLEAFLENESDDLTQETENLCTWPLFTTLKFLVEEAGLLLGPFPRVAKAYRQLQKSKPVVAHTRLVKQTMELVSNEGGGFVQSPTWPHSGFLRELQRQLADYTADPVERMVEGVSGEKGPLKMRVSGGRFGMQPVSARMPWTMQGERLGKV